MGSWLVVGEKKGLDLGAGIGARGLKGSSSVSSSVSWSDSNWLELEDRTWISDLGAGIFGRST